MLSPYCSCVIPETLLSERLELVWLPPESLDALLAGRREDVERSGDFAIPDDWPDEHDRRLLAYRLRQVRDDETQAPWLVRAIVLGGEMIGHIGFHGSPGRNARKDQGAVEVGYTIFPEHRGQGYATEAVVALLDWGRRQGIERFIASVGPGNEPSLALVHRLGFREVGRHWDDEDGEELEFVLEPVA